MVGPDVLFISGNDELSKDNKISLLKKEFSSQCLNLKEFNIDDLDAKVLTLKDLRHIVERLPLKVKQRLLIIRNVDFLNDLADKYLVEVLKNKSSYLRIVFCAREEEGKAANKLISFLRQSKSVAKIFCRQERKIRVFDLARNIVDSSNLAHCLGILRQLLTDGKQAPQILGGLFWYWKNVYAQDKVHILRSDLELFLETDVSIKTGRLNSDLALELLIVKLYQRRHSSSG
jgi:DNA polymerase III delta subunit